ncbi:histidinol-phosphate transaminase [Clostridium celatum]|uniref:pyridoxal phosphate-dependent aminotransferase n=1 Tax=Clostridium celatum TaxID=36834 RepID=UPI0018986F7E|nr:aminotransferase class I/II-fold pyridoxal phosphate-dependent enzyme [Clostridium celatum]MDU6294871.1 aminotransferase class I/II-fold pyridoxal phosphate-dependent enzyme [Clostridium celatum]
MKKINTYKNIMNNKIGIRVNGNESYKNLDNEDLLNALESTKNTKFNRYPDSDSKRLREEYGRLIDMPLENIIAGNGSDEMISLVIAAYVKRKSVVMTIKPDFSMYDFYVSLNNGVIKKFETREDGSFSLDDFIAFGKEINPNLIIISNPNNPTGHTLNNIEILKILDVFRESKILIDEAYYEFYGQTMLKYVNEYKNLIITRTLSKAWGLAALRVGFLISNEDNVVELNKYKVPYNLNQLSQDIACNIINHPEKVIKNVEEIVSERERLYKNLKEIELRNKEIITFYPSKANFIFAKSKYKDKIKAEMEEQGILIRYFNDDTFRISIGESWENDLIITVIKKALGYEVENNV